MARPLSIFSARAFLASLVNPATWAAVSDGRWHSLQAAFCGCPVSTMSWWQPAQFGLACLAAWQPTQLNFPDLRCMACSKVTKPPSLVPPRVWHLSQASMPAWWQAWQESLYFSWALWSKATGSLGHGFGALLFAGLHIIGDEDGIRLTPHEPRHFMVRQLGHRLLVPLGYLSQAFGPVAILAADRNRFLHTLLGQVQVAEHALLVRRLLKTFDAVLFLVQVTDAAAAFLAFGIKGLLLVLVIFVVADAAVILVGVVGGDVL